MNPREILDAVGVAMGPGVVSADMEQGRLLRLPVSARVHGVVGPWSEGLHLDRQPDGQALSLALATADAFGIDGAIRWVQADAGASDEVVALGSAAGRITATRPVLQLGEPVAGRGRVPADGPLSVDMMASPQDGAAFDALLRWIDLDVPADTWRARGQRQRVAAGAGSGVVWVARTPTMPVGVVARWWSGDTHVLAPVVVHEAWRRKGVATALLRAAWAPGAWLFGDGRGWLAELATGLGARVVAHLAELRPIPDPGTPKA